MMIFLGQAVNLIPDATTIPQLFIFLTVMLVLYLFVFKPTLKILDRRRERTLELQKETERLSTDADAMDKEYDRILLSSKNDGTKTEQELLSRGESEARTIIAEAKRLAHETVSKEREKTTAEAAATNCELSKKIDELSKMIIDKALGKPVATKHD